MDQNKIKQTIEDVFKYTTCSITGFDIKAEDTNENIEQPLRLSERHFQILNMKYVDELKIEEIAHILEEPPTEVRKLIAEAMRGLASTLLED